MFGEGISKAGDILDLAVDANFIQKAGAWFSFNDEKIGQGKENAKAWLKEHPTELQSLEKAIRLLYDIQTDKSA